jgi:hypothetical protein
MKPDERPRSGEDMGLKRVHLGPVADHEGGTVLSQKRIDVLDEPGGVAELEAVPLRER